MKLTVPGDAARFRPAGVVAWMRLPQFRSLRARLAILWLLLLAACISVGLLLLSLHARSTEAQASRAEAVTARSCDLIRDRYAFYMRGVAVAPPALDDPALRRDLAAAVTLALQGQEGVEGGIWHVQDGPLAYAFPTYAGTGPKTDLPAAERDRIAAVNERAARDEQASSQRFDSRAQTLLLQACPLPGPIAGLTGWAMTRVQAQDGVASLRAAMAVLFALMLASSIWLARLLAVWRRQVGALETALHDARGGELPLLERGGEREFDRIVDALNDARARLAAARAETERMEARAAASERLAALGRVAGGLAHEIRNPLAALRLQGENALAGDADRQRVAIGAMLEQVARLDALVRDLLAMTQRRPAAPQEIQLDAYLTAAAARHRDGSVAIEVEVADEARQARLDPTLVDRVLDNLLDNAVRHARGEVRVAAGRDADRLRITVQDDGDGVAPALRQSLFEPFVTGRAEGTGLGLALAREFAEAHGGTLQLADAGGGACFVLELPQGDAWQRS